MNSYSPSFSSVNLLSGFVKKNMIIPIVKLICIIPEIPERDIDNALDISTFKIVIVPLINNIRAFPITPIRYIVQ